MRTLAVVITALAARSAVAAPTNAEAKAAFDRGVAAYTKGDYAAASDSLEKSFRLEPDPETLFAWAQAERKLSRCEKAIKLYERLLKFEVPAENRQAIQANLDDCKANLGPAKPDAPKQVVVVKHDDHGDRPPVAHDEPRPWWRDPIGDTFLGAGVVGLGVGVAFVVAAHGSDSQAKSSPNYFTFQDLENKAKSQSTNGAIAAGAGAALVGIGVIWYAAHRSSDRDTRISGWIDGAGGGLGVAGAF
jgi:tetratricopeptide (TPR) repeat protein